MTPDELRALADALDPSGKVLTHPGDSALQRATTYLRAQAEAQPVAAAPQAEPKRAPLSDERIAEIQRAAYERAAARVIEMIGDRGVANAIRELGRQQ